jgi:hypothetical protein
MLKLEKFTVHELVAMRSAFLRGQSAIDHSTPKEREKWLDAAETITAELTRRNES